ncbi:hypothetical protein [Lysobacter gummosus]|uniref:hypothetical protein n=1 Tax=Lysobacter gummosus TaxID=262324 RepID=UPI003643AB50
MSKGRGAELCFYSLLTPLHSLLSLPSPKPGAILARHCPRPAGSPPSTRPTPPWTPTSPRACACRPASSPSTRPTGSATA